MKVNFVRKPTPSELYPQDEFIIEKVVRLSKAEFEDLLKNPLNDRDYVRDNKEKMEKLNLELGMSFSDAVINALDAKSQQIRAEKEEN